LLERAAPNRPGGALVEPATTDRLDLDHRTVDATPPHTRSERRFHRLARLTIPEQNVLPRTSA